MDPILLRLSVFYDQNELTGFVFKRNQLVAYSNIVLLLTGFAFVDVTSNSSSITVALWHLYEGTQR